MQRSFDKWKQGQTQEDIQTSLIETDGIIQKQNLTGSSIQKIYRKKKQALKHCSRESILIQNSLCFDEFKAHYIQAGYRENILKPKEVIPWREIENFILH